MAGFFTDDLFADIELTVDTCNGCEFKKSGIEKFPMVGKFKKKILLINKGRFTLIQRILLGRILTPYGIIDINNDCGIIECHGCKSGGFSERCHEKLALKISELSPRYIITLGEEPFVEVIKGISDMKLGEFATWTGYTIPLHKYNAILIPTHPIIDTDELANQIIEPTKSKPQMTLNSKLKQQIKDAVHIRKQIEIDLDLNYDHDLYEDVKHYALVDKCIEIVDENGSIDIMNKISLEKGQIAIDYETNCLSPFRESAELVSCSIYFKGISYAFMITTENTKLLTRILADKNISKIIANVSFEKAWTNKHLGCELNGKIDDIVIQNSVLYNKKSNGVKLQSVAQLGIFDYAKDITPLLKSSDGSHYNRIHEINKRDLLRYNAIDSLVEFWLFKLHQKNFIKNNTELRKAYNLLNSGNVSLSEISYNGLDTDTNFYEEQVRVIDQKLEALNIEFEKDKVVIQWKEEFGTEYNPDSTKQLGYIVYDKLGNKPFAFTKKEVAKVDKDTLAFFDIGFLGIREQISKLKNAKNTFIKGITSNSVAGKIHPSYSLTRVPSYRSSCYQPNFQNMPKHDKEVSFYVRGGIVPSKGNQLLEADFSGAEVSTGYSYHRDPKMLEYLTTEGTDMHRDVTMDSFMLSIEQMTPSNKTEEDRVNILRFQGKNGFTFAEFYGSYYKPIAEIMWRNLNKLELQLMDGQPLTDHLKSKGISNLKKFTKHMQEVERIFWEDRFFGYKKWKGETVAKYRKDGFLQSYTGFIYRGNLTDRQICNYPIQGSSFHCLLWSINRLKYYFDLYGLKSKMVGQIHDSLVVDLVPEECKQVLYLMKKVMQREVIEENPWIQIPFKVDFELTDIDKSWYYKKAI